MSNAEKENISERNKRLLRGSLLEVLTFSPIFLGLGVFFFLQGLLPSSSLYSLMSFIAGFSGVIIVIRKEVPSPFWTVRGTAAVLQGIAFTIICWGGALYILFAGL
jgi:hypothetical protein